VSDKPNEQSEQTSVEAGSDQDRPSDARQPDPCWTERVDAETAESKPGAAGLALRSTRSKC
jgi:hypothetical protein